MCAAIAGLQDFRQEGPPADIGTFQLPCNVLVFQHTFSGTTYVCAIRSGVRRWVLIAHLPSTAANDTIVIQAALDTLTAGRTWKEKIIIKGSFTINAPIYLDSYTILKLICFIQASVNFQILDTGVPPGPGGIRRMIVGRNQQAALPKPEYIDIIGGVIDCNKANQPAPPYANDWTGILFFNGTHINIYKTIVRNSKAWGIYFDNVAHGYLHHVICETNDFYGMGYNHAGGLILGCRCRSNGASGLRLSEKCPTVVGGEYSYNTGSGIEFMAVASENLHAYDGSVYGAFCHHNTLDGVTMAVDGAFYALKNSIRDCILVDNSRYGFNEIVGANYNLLSGGSIHGNLAGDVNRTGAATIVENIQDYVTENHVLSPAFAIDGVAIVTVTIPHGLNVTPAVEDCQLTVVENTAVDDWAEGYHKVISVGAVNVVAKVKVTTASATGGATAKLALHVTSER